MQHSNPRRAATTDATAELQAAFAREPELIQAMLVGLDEAPADQQTLILTAVSQAAESRPDQADSHYFAARAAVARSDWPLAGECVRKALAINPKYNDALILGARIEHTQGHNAEAVKNLEDALANGADYADVHLLLGDVHCEAGNTEGARKAYERARQLNPRLTAVHQRLCQLTTNATEDKSA